MQTYLDFEKPIAELEGKVLELKHLAQTDDTVDIDAEVETLSRKASQLLTETYANLDAWQKTQVARHPDRPHALDYVNGLITEFTPMAGDKLYSEDRAMIGGIGRFRGRSVVVLGTEKGRTTKARVEHNFGMARPEGYRKAQRLFKFAQRFNMPVLTFIDTAGAYPGIGAEERGQSEAIARAIEVSLNIRVPVIACIIGEGGSGGAVALAVGDKVIMLEHSIYSVISPEACSSILFKTSDRATDAAIALKLTAQSLENLGVTDLVVPEPVGGAHRATGDTIQSVGQAIADALDEVAGMAPETLLERRREKFLAIGRASA